MNRAFPAPSSDPYQVLGVPPAATIEQIKAAYRRRAVRHHPDRNAGSKQAEERFKHCGEAYTLLSSPDARTAHDARSWSGRGAKDLVGGLLQELLHGPTRRRRAGRDLHATVELSLEQSAIGVRIPVSLTVDELCLTCEGLGCPRDGRQRCPHCQGKGELERASIISLPRICPDCGGQGRRAVRPCGDCAGVGMLERDHEVLVALPAGTHDRAVHALAGQGEPGLNGGSGGDLHVAVRVKQHPFFERQGLDLVVEIPITVATAALGGSALVPTLDGKVRMQIPAGVQSGHLFRLRGKGMARATRRGDILARLTVETPVNLTVEQRELLRQLEAACSPECLPRSRVHREQLEQLFGSKTEP